MARRSGKAVPLGDVKTRAGSCAACRAPLGTEEPIAWTWARQRIHESCMPIWAFADRGRRALGDWIAEPVRLLLERHQGRLCSSCLALALSLSLEEARQIVEMTASLPGFQVLPVACETCGRSTMTLCIVPNVQRMAEGCSQALLARDRSRISRSLSRQSRKQLDRARARLDRPGGTSLP